jgi:integrase
MRKLHKLTAAKVAAIKQPGRHSDGGNLILRVDDDRNKTFGFRYRLDGKETTLGLGAWPTVSLSEAREKAVLLRKQLADRRDPKAERDKVRAAERAAAARLLTVREAARRFLADREGTWRNEQHRRDFRNSLDTHVLPVIGSLSVAAIDTPAVLKVLERDNFWRTKPETASRCRSRIEMLLDWAAARSYRDRENPAKWRGHLDHILPAPKLLAPVRHHPALPWQQIPAFMTDLRGREGVAPRTLEFCILTASRISEVLGAVWSEFDFAAKTWTVPGVRMKSGREHVVPLSTRAVEILRALSRDDVRPFPTHRVTIGVFLRERMGRRGITVHGFRSSFSTWCAESTATAVEVREAALAHQVRDATRAAYQRGSLLQKRKLLMDAWGKYCSAPARPDSSKVVGMRATARG